MSFSELGLNADILRAVSEAGYTDPTPIQAQAIPVVISGRDVIGIAQTGTGKTAGFTLPMIHTLAKGRAKARMPRSLILEPTRELAAQVSENFEKYGKYHKLNMALLIGGVSYENQDAKIDRGVDVLIATPGRLLDHFERGKLLLNQVQILVVDEADRMLDMGFIPDVERICKLLPFTRQTLFFSATMAPEIQRLTDQFLSNPVRIEVAKPATAAATIEQALIHTPSQDWAKREVLRHLFRSQQVVNGIVFCNRKTDVAILHRSLVKHGFSAGALHGDMSQPDRLKTLDAFRAGQIQYLVASDVAARGLDIPTVSHVFNFDVPINAEDYVHRIGRTGRAGRTGHAFMLVAGLDRKRLAAIEALSGQPIFVHTLEGFEMPQPQEGEASDCGGVRGRGGRGRERSSEGGRGRGDRAPEGGRRHGGKPHRSRSEAPVMAESAPFNEPQPEMLQEEVAQLPARVHGERDAQHRPSRPQRAKQDEPREERPKGRERRDADDRPVVGLGDHVPAFLLRPTKLPPRTPSGQEAA